MNDMSKVIEPKSDQLNADDLIVGPITVTITGVKIRGGQEQPIAISYEGDNGKPYKPCKSMCRVMVTAWGPDSAKYSGRSMTLYRDPSIKWAGMEVGGIRISHMSHIESKITMALTMTKGSRKPYVVKPLESTKQAAPQASSPTAEESPPPPATPADAAPDVISADQAIWLEDELHRAKATPKEFFDAMGIPKCRLAQIPADKWAKAKEYVEQRGA